MPLRGGEIGDRGSLVGAKCVDGAKMRRGLVTEQRFYNTDSARRGDSNPVLQLEAGRYVLRIRNDANQTGAYAFQLADLAAATGLVAGAQMVGALNPGQETDFHTFTAQAGERWYFNLQQIDNGDGTWRVIGPLGQQVAWNYLSGSGDIEATLPQSGTYVVMIEGLCLMEVGYPVDPFGG